jgi:hypothetical protein
MDNLKINMNKIAKIDFINFRIFAKNMLEIRYKKLKKTGKDMSQKKYFEKILLNIHKKKFNLTVQTKEYLTSFFEKMINKEPFIVNKKSKVYIKAFEYIQDNFINIQKKNLEETKNFIQFYKKILNALNKYKLNSAEKDSLIINYFVSIGFDEVEVRLLLYKSIIDNLENIIIFLQEVQKELKK